MIVSYVYRKADASTK